MVKEYKTSEPKPREWEKELREELGENYVGITVTNGRLMEIRVKTDLPTSKKDKIKTKFGVDLI